MRILFNAHESGFFYGLILYAKVIDWLAGEKEGKGIKAYSPYCPELVV